MPSQFDSGTKTAVVTETITAATQENPVEITVTGTALVNGDSIFITGVAGMTEINNRRFVVTNQQTNAVDLEGEDGTGHTAYSSAGTVGNIRHRLGTTQPQTADHVIQAVVDLSLMVRADSVYIYIFEEARSSDGAGIARRWPFNNTQIEPLFMSDGLILLHSWDLRIEQFAGTGRVFDWSLRQAD